MKASPATSPAAKPPPGLLWPAKSRYTEKTRNAWNSRRTATSRTIERLPGASVRPASSHALRFSSAVGASPAGTEWVRDSGVPLRSRGRGRTDSVTGWNRERPRLGAPSGEMLSPCPVTKTRLATPIAHAMTTASSPIVSHARMSTRVTLTMFCPWPPSYASRGNTPEIGRCWRAPRTTTARTIITTANDTAMTVRSAGVTLLSPLPIRAGRRRSTNTKTTIVMVSTRIWVSARSGAPWNAKKTTIA